MGADVVVCVVGAATQWYAPPSHWLRSPWAPDPNVTGGLSRPPSKKTPVLKHTKPVMG